MHEISLVRSIINSLQTEFSAEELVRLTGIDLKIGLLSNVEPLLMQNAFSAVQTAEGIYKDVALHIEVVPIKIYCDSCQQDSLIQEYKFVCASCGIPNNNIIAGTELLIHQVHFADTLTAPEQNT